MEALFKQQNMKHIALFILCLAFLRTLATMTTKTTIQDWQVKNDFADTFQEKLFYSVVKPTPLPSPYLVAWNDELANEMNLLQFEPWHNEQDKQQVLEYFGGSKPLNNGKVRCCIEQKGNIK